MYSNEEYELIQNILGKDKNNHYYTKEELEFVNTILNKKKVGVTYVSSN